MPQDDVKHGAAEVLKVQEALKILYDLLEEYAPEWYTKEHHDKAEAALRFNGKMPQNEAQRPEVAEILKHAAQLKIELTGDIAPRLLKAHQNALEDEVAAWKRMIDNDKHALDAAVRDLRRALSLI